MLQDCGSFQRSGAAAQANNLCRTAPVDSLRCCVLGLQQQWHPPAGVNWAYDLKASSNARLEIGTAAAVLG
ncbi:hypothetical protein OEZ86_000853 [Tetradesmus obliquus]|nr:hypothetical protein OEZ86_000853 [Tetradesmus obliquus]